jgi:formate-dependent phosphoribosylglycinamide formyltransferase (GAR transformylase)
MEVALVIGKTVAEARKKAKAAAKKVRVVNLE